MSISSDFLSDIANRTRGNESSRERKFHLSNFRSQERKYVRTKVW